VLHQCSPSELRGLPDRKEDYIQGFLLHKVLRTKFAASRLDSAAALCTFFVRYLRSMLKSSANRMEYLQEESELDRLAEGGGDDSACEWTSNEDRLGFKRFLESAVQFWQDLDTEDQIYLSLHACDPDGEPLYAIAARYRIASYHYRAGRLGITRKKGELPSTFSQTRIGKWMTDRLHIAMSAESMEDVSRAFQALCATALAMRDALLAKVDYA
jgi:hypothetical protein